MTAGKITNSKLAELLCIEAVNAKHYVQRALRKASARIYGRRNLDSTKL